MLPTVRQRHRVVTDRSRQMIDSAIKQSAAGLELLQKFRYARIVWQEDITHVAVVKGDFIAIL